MTGLDLITSSLRLLGVLASGESLPASEAADALISFNDMLDSWSNETLMIPNKVRETFPLVVGQQTYTMGPGGNFNTTRPIAVENVLIQIPEAASPLELSMKILTKDQFAGIILKGIHSTYPLYVYPEGTYPLETFNFWTIPSAPNNVVIYSSKQLLDIADPTIPLDFNPGYQRALRYNLALELAPEYGRAVPDLVASIAAESKMNLKRKNAKPQFLEVDDALRAKTAVWNWYTGEPQ